MLSPQESFPRQGRNRRNRAGRHSVIDLGSDGGPDRDRQAAHAVPHGLQRVRLGYVDKVDDKALIKGAIVGMLASLDPHSSYMAGSDFDNFKIRIDGNYPGIGASVVMDDGFLKVVGAHRGQPGLDGRRQARRLHHAYRRQDRLWQHARRGGREPARRAGHQGQADHRPRRPRRAVRSRHSARRHRPQAGQVGSQGRHRHHQHQRVLDRRGQGRAHCHPRHQDFARPRTRSATSSICVPIRAAISTKPSASPDNLPRLRADRLAARPLPL